METMIFFLEEAPEFQFKSYYVVWKPKRFPGAERSRIMFKSYYVVWKPR